MLSAITGYTIDPNSMLNESYTDLLIHSVINENPTLGLEDITKLVHAHKAWHEHSHHYTVGIVRIYNVFHKKKD